MDWTATTESGSVYTGGTGRYFTHNGEVYRCQALKVIDRLSLDPEDPWKLIHETEWTDLPEVGKSIYIMDMSKWRLSTKVTSVQLN